jgi:hypothetical protein
MVRTLMVGMAALVLSAGALLAAAFTGKVKSVDAEKKTITVTVEGKDVAFDASGAEIVSKKSGKAVKNGLAGIKAEVEVTVTADEAKDGAKASKIEVSFKKKAAN